MTFTVPDAGGGSNTPAHNGPLGIKYAAAAYGGNQSRNRLEAWASVYVGINEHPSASAWLSNNFRAPGEGSAPVTAQVSSDVNWKGVLAGNGAAGTGASVTITLSLLDGSKTIASTVVHTLEQREKALTLGGLDDVSSASADLTALLVPGRLYQLRLTLTCSATSGLLGAATHCVYGPSGLYEDGHVDWGTRTILFGP